MNAALMSAFDFVLRVKVIGVKVIVFLCITYKQSCLWSLAIPRQQGLLLFLGIYLYWKRIKDDSKTSGKQNSEYLQHN